MKIDVAAAMVGPAATGAAPTATDLTKDVAAELRHRISSGRLAPGERLVEAKLARELGISRAPIREAARLLESVGLLVSERGRGFFVRRVTLRQLEDVFEVRLCIERHATAAAARNLTSDLSARFDEAVLRIKEACARGDVPAQVLADFAFHRLVVEATGNQMLVRIFNEIALDLRLVIGLLGEASADWEIMAQSHDPVVAAIRSRDPERAAAAMDAHIHLAWDQALARLRRSTAA